MPSTIEVLKHVMSPKRRWPILLGLFLGWLVIWCANIGPEPDIAPWWANWIDPWITMGTLAVAVLLGLRALADELPKRLTIHFVYEGRYVLTCWEASLTGEGDIRGWAQQVGSQMAAVPRLDFDPYPQISPPRTRGGALGLRQVYVVTITLTKEPPPANVSGYLVWGPGRHDKASWAERPESPMTVQQILQRQAEAPSGREV